MGHVVGDPCVRRIRTLYGSASDSQWHECGHGTAFKTQWTNIVVYNVAAFMVLREPVSWRWSHDRHHDDTIIVGRDAEIAVPRGSSLLKLTSELFNLQSGPKELRKLALTCVGAVTAEEREYLPESEFQKAWSSARVSQCRLSGLLADSSVQHPWHVASLELALQSELERTDQPHVAIQTKQ